jgi:hypothetical protein
MAAASDAKGDLQAKKSVGNFFQEEHIVAWQYPVARTLTEFMVTQSRKGYVDFINGIKDGLRWDEAITQKYGVSVPQLLHAYGVSEGVTDLKFE